MAAARNVPDETLEVSSRFFRLVRFFELGVHPLLICDAPPSVTRRIFLVRYLIGEGFGGEASRPIFRSELTGYNYQSRRTHPTKETGLGNLQFILEAKSYGAETGTHRRITLVDSSTGDRFTVKAIISQEAVDELSTIYEYGF